MLDDIELVQREINAECDAVKVWLLEKNSQYTDTALSPINIFSDASAVEQIKILIDDRLKRIKVDATADNSLEQELIGYLVLLRIARKYL